MKSEDKARWLKKPHTESVSLISWWPAQLVLILISAAAWSAGMETPAMLMAGAAFFGLVCRLWAFLAWKNLQVRVDVPKTGIFPGSRAEVQFSVKNSKLMPVSWLDAVMPLEKPLVINPGEDMMDRDDEKFAMRCSVIDSRSHCTFNTQWDAVRRGLVTLKDMGFFTGDGFGFVKCRVETDPAGVKEIAVYPRLLPVDIERFVSSMWEGENSPKGILEDVSLIKLTRPYEEYDSLKKINWRMLARGQQLSVNQYEVIRPKKIHFIFDGESFNGDEPREGELEDALSILASLVMRLDEWGMECGFSFPATRRLRPSNIFPAGETSREILYRMAEYQMIPPEYNSEASAANERRFFAPSYFDTEGIIGGWQQLGKVWFITFSNDSAARSKTLQRLRGLPVNVLVYDELIRLKGGSGNEK